MTTPLPDGYVSLLLGPSVPVAALQLVWRLEERGFTMRVDQSGELLVSPGSRLSAEDREQLRRLRRAVTAIVEYCDSPPLRKF
jgi:hypothetical protein